MVILVEPRTKYIKIQTFKEIEYNISVDEWGMRKYNSITKVVERETKIIESNRIYKAMVTYNKK